MKCRDIYSKRELRVLGRVYNDENEIIIIMNWKKNLLLFRRNNEGGCNSKIKLG